jgi:hypothetical protein
MLSGGWRALEMELDEMRLSEVEFLELKRVTRLEVRVAD